MNKVSIVDCIEYRDGLFQENIKKFDLEKTLEIVNEQFAKFIKENNVPDIFEDGECWYQDLLIK